MTRTLVHMLHGRLTVRGRQLLCSKPTSGQLMVLHRAAGSHCTSYHPTAAATARLFGTSPEDILRFVSKTAACSSSSSSSSISSNGGVAAEDATASPGSLGTCCDHCHTTIIVDKLVKEEQDRRLYAGGCRGWGGGAKKKHVES